MNVSFINNGKRYQKFIEIKTSEGTLYEETIEWKKYKNQKIIDKKLKEGKIFNLTSGMSIEGLTISTDKKEKIKKYMSQFESKFKSIHLYFWSTNNSTQKTTTASLIAKSLIELGFSSYFILMSDLINSLINQQFNEADNELINTLNNVDFLIIDDAFDTKKMTIYKSGYQVSYLDTFLRNRLEGLRKAICFTSNIPINKISTEKFSTSIQQLIERNIIDSWEFKNRYDSNNAVFNIDNLWI